MKLKLILATAITGAALILPGSSSAATSSSPFQFVSQSAVYNPRIGEVTFSVLFNQEPDFFSTDSAGRQADSFQYYIVGNPSLPYPGNYDSVIRGEELHASIDLLPVRNAVPGDLTDPLAGTWGTVRGEVPYTLSGRKLTFAAPLSLISDHTGASSISYRLETVEFGGLTGYVDSQIVLRPETFITGGPSGVINDPTPTFSFSSPEPGSSFQCKLDSGSYSACASPKTTSHLDDGPHTFYVRAKDSAGHVDPTPASRTFTVRTASVRVSDSALVVTAAPGAHDNLQITQPSRSIVRVTDFPAGAYAGSGVHTGVGCSRSGDYTANCLAAAITPTLPALVTSAGMQADKVANSSGLPSSLYGGAGADQLIGGPARDILNGGAGSDLLQGLAGNDLLQGHDGVSDKLIDCGVGSDKANLDLLPLDANIQGCEIKTRH